MDCVLEQTRDAVLEENEWRDANGVNTEPFMKRKAGQSFVNSSRPDMKCLVGDQDHLRVSLTTYMQAITAEVRNSFERFNFITTIDIEPLHKTKRLWLVTE